MHSELHGELIHASLLLGGTAPLLYYLCCSPLWLLTLQLLSLLCFLPLQLDCPLQLQLYCLLLRLHVLRCAPLKHLIELRKHFIHLRKHCIHLRC